MYKGRKKVSLAGFSGFCKNLDRFQEYLLVKLVELGYDLCPWHIVSVGLAEDGS